MKKLSLGIASTFLFVTIAALAANFTDDQLQFGKPGSSANKEIVFGASNKKKLKHVPGTLTLDYEGNNLSVGDGLNTSDKTFKLNKGGSSPTFRHNFTSGDLEIENAPVLNQKGNTVSVGDGTNTNKVLKFNKGANSPEIRYNSTTSKIEFSNDASLYKAIGSGSGGGGDGGKNLLTNGSFEDGISLEWSNTGGTFTQGTYTNGTDDDSKYANFVASGSGQYFETTLKAVPDSLGAGCMADLKYFGGSGNFKLQALDSSANVLSEIALVNTTSWQKSPTIAFPCPAPGATMRARIISTGAGTIQGDLVYIGGNKNISQVSQATVWAQARWAPNPSCHYAANGATVFTHFSEFTADTDCNNPTVSGRATVPGTKVPQLVVPFVPKGKYVLRINSDNQNFSGTGSSQNGCTDGITLGSERSNYGPSIGNTIGAGGLTCYFEYATDQTNVAFRPIGQGTGGTSVPGIANFESTQDEMALEMWLTRFPSDQEQAVTNEQSSWLIDANIGGEDFTFNSIASTYTAMESPNLDLVLNTAKGSANAEIPCNTTNPSTGLTCAAGSENIGVAFTPPYAGLFEACVDFWFASAPGNATTFQLVETPNNAQTILQEGGQKTGSSGGGAQIDSSMHVCGTFKFDSTAKRTIRLMFESPDTATRLIAIGRGSTLGQRDLKITVKPVLQNVARPVLTGDQVTTPGASQPILFGFNYATTTEATPCSGTPCLLVQTGNIVTSVTRSATGQYVANFNGTYSRVRCTGNASGSGMEAFFFGFPVLTCSNCSTLTMNTSRRDTGAFIDTVGTLNCMAIK